MAEHVARLLPHQHELLADEASHPLCFVGGVRSGKTWGMAAKALQLGVANGDLPILFVEPTFRMLEDVAFRTFAAVLEDWRIPYTWHKSSFILRPHIGPGFDILLRSADRPERLMGLTVAAALLDEAGQCKEAVAQELLRRVSHPKAAVRQLVLGGTPEGINWFRDWAEEPSSERGRLIRARTDDNHHMGQQYIEDMCAYLSEEEIRMRRMGQFVPLGGHIYHRWDRERHAVPCENVRAGRHQMWCDFNIDAQAWCLVRVINGEPHIFDECVGEGDTQQRAEIAGGLWRSYGIPPGQVDVYCDASGSARKTSAKMSDVQLLKRAGFKSVRHPAANPAVRDRIAAVNLALSEDRFFIDPKATYFMKCISSQGRDKHGEPDKSGGLDHGADAVGYGIVNQWPVRVSSRGNAVRYH